MDFAFFFLFFFQILWMRGKFTACVANRLNHGYSIYGFDQGLELCTWGAIKFIEKFLYTITLKLCIIIFLKLNFVPNLHYKDVNVTPRYKICLQFASRKVPSEIMRRVQIWMGKMTTSVLKHINIFFYSESNNYCTTLPMVANFFYSGH